MIFFQFYGKIMEKLFSTLCFPKIKSTLFPPFAKKISWPYLLYSSYLGGLPLPPKSFCGKPWNLSNLTITYFKTFYTGIIVFHNITKHCTRKSCSNIIICKLIHNQIWSVPRTCFFFLSLICSINEPLVSNLFPNKSHSTYKTRFYFVIWFKD